MNAQPALHPTDQTLHAYGLGKLDDASAESVNAHLERCPDCRRRVAELSSDSFLGRLQDAKVRPDSFRPLISSTDGLSLLDGGPAPAAPPPASTLPPGLADLPDYQILRELGQGGMGVVFLAQNTLMGRMEVLKVVSGHLLNRRGVLDRFQGEIRNAAKLHHPNIVAAYTALRLGESLVLSMEYVEGLDLSRIVKAHGPLPVAKACNYIHQVALGLQHAHEHGMVHRDIKPSNLMLARQGNCGVVKVLDFGLAKVTSEGAVDGGLTHEGQMLGTPDYIAPEQISNARRADIRADIYSLGCTLYYLLTGKPPFQGDSLYDILQAHHSMEATPLNLLRPEVPVEVAAIVAKMMAKEPVRRFQEPKEVAQALKPFFKVGDVTPVGSKPDLSKAISPEPRRETAGVGPVPIRTAAGPEPATASPDNKPAQTPRSEPMWDSLVDLKATDRSPDRAPAVVSNRRPPWLWPSAAVGVLLLGLIAVWATGVIKIKTPEGYIVLRDLPDQATVLMDGKKATVRWPDDGGPAEITVVPGEHMVEVKKDGFRIRGQKVNVERNGLKTLVVQLEPLEIPEPEKVPGTGNSPRSDTPTPEKGDEKGRPAPSVVPRPQAPPASGASAPSREITNSIGMKLALIPAGNFKMGSPDSDLSADDATEKPQQQVKIERPFYLGVHEVTQAEYQAVMNENPTYFARGDDLPVLIPRTTWKSAVQFCNQLSEKENLEPYCRFGAESKAGSDGYRLPTEAEWEYACRARWDTPYPFDEKAHPLDDYAWYASNSAGKPHPVGQKRPNDFGLYDMLGNATELCDSVFVPGKPPVIAPLDLSLTVVRVKRGGNWLDPPSKCRSTNRTLPWEDSDGSWGKTGFRVARNHFRAPKQVPGTVDSPDPARRGADKPAQIRAVNAVIALKGMAEIRSGRWLVEGRELVQTDATEDQLSRVLFGVPHWRNYDFTVDLMRQEGKGCAGLLFRRSLLNDDRLAFLIAGHPNEACQLFAFEDGQERELGAVKK